MHELRTISGPIPNHSNSWRGSFVRVKGSQSSAMSVRVPSHNGIMPYKSRVDDHSLPKFSSFI